MYGLRKNTTRYIKLWRMNMAAIKTSPLPPQQSSSRARESQCSHLYCKHHRVFESKDSFELRTLLNRFLQ